MDRRKWSRDDVNRLFAMRDVLRLKWREIGEAFGVDGSVCCTRYQYYKGGGTARPKASPPAAVSKPAAARSVAAKAEASPKPVPRTEPVIHRPRYFHEADADCREDPSAGPDGWLPRRSASRPVGAGSETGKHVVKLTDLDPTWLMSGDGSKRIGFTFISPTNPKARQSCFPNPPKVSEQIDLFDAAHGEDRMVQPCNPDQHWQIAGGIDAATFETMTVTPSLDGSKGGLWHGFITNGEIK